MRVPTVTYATVLLLVVCFSSNNHHIRAEQLDQETSYFQREALLDENFVESETRGFSLFGWISRWWNRVEYRGKKVSVVDMHLHTGRWDDLPESFQDDLLDLLPIPFIGPTLARPFVNVLLSAYGIAAQLIWARISKGVLFAVYAPDTTGSAENKFVKKQIHKLLVPNKFYGLASLPVNDWDTNEDDALDLLRKYLAKDEFIGVKMAHPHMKINFTDNRFYSIYGVAAEFDKPVFLHTGLALTEGSLINREATHPDFTEEFIKLYTNVTFILGHMGNKADFDDLNHPYDACFRLATNYSNVYLEASALGSEPNDPDGDLLTGVFQRTKALGLISRMLYGSDGPQFPGYVKSYLERTLDAMDRADYTVDEAELVLEQNFNQLFQV